MSKQQEKYIAGIDEAGRGPAIGPMVYAFAAIPVSLENTVKKLGANDSKQLTDDQRRSIFTNLKKLEHFEYSYRAVSAQEISERMNAISKHSLNLIAFEAARDLLVEFCKNHQVEHVYIDLISPAEQYGSFIKEKLPNLKMTIAAKADATYPITGAASIVAKVTRDNAIRSEQGSGYPSDPNTQNFLSKNCDKLYGFTKDVRMSWSTTVKIMQQQCVQCQWQISRELKPEQTPKKPGLLHQLGFFFKKSSKQ